MRCGRVQKVADHRGRQRFIHVHETQWRHRVVLRRLKRGGGGVVTFHGDWQRYIHMHWISEPNHFIKGWVDEPLVVLLGWRVIGQIYNADIYGISIVMEIFLFNTMKNAIDRVFVLVLRFFFFSHNNHLFYWSPVFDRAWLWSSSLAKLSIWGAEQLFSSPCLPYLVIGWFRLYWSVNLKSRQNCSHQINAYAIWPEKSRETGRFLLPSLSSLSVRGECYSFLCY